MACLLFSWSIILSCRSHVVLGCGIHFHTPCMALGAGRASPACVNDQVKAVIPGARRRFVQKARGSYATVRTSLLLFVCRFEDAPVVPPCVGLRVYCSSEAKPPKGWNACKLKKDLYRTYAQHAFHSFPLHVGTDSGCRGILFMLPACASDEPAPTGPSERICLEIHF
jgi:hypothetical protein